MDYQIIKARVEEKEVLKNLMQFYFYDFTEFMDGDVKENGQFGDYPYLDHYWTEDHRFPYIVEVEGRIAGFVFVRRILSNEESYYSIAEFFIMKKYRRLGIGKQVATSIFDLHKGHWEVFQIEKNKPAQLFWRKVIDEYSSGNFQEREKDGGKIQLFESIS